MIKIIIKFFKNGVIGSNKGISIILAIIIIVILGLAGSIFAYLISSGSIVSRSNLLSAEAKYAAKSGVEITMYELEQNPNPFSGSPLSGCPTNPVLPPVVEGSIGSPLYLSGNLQGGLPPSADYTPTFCAVEGTLTLSGSTGGNCTYYIITSNGFAGGTEREVTAEVGIKKNGNNCTGIYVESELPNSN
ncbi:MAG: hypothetical protein M0016_02140 [Deltaproteobacteria bacterium]|jgi:hypothetical protein|nr:hypothetical protein [Deltaproteobacteria bacterium]MCL5880319.1 hypothetical protein [Deltaproteobacteria bacterium]MDA8303947.1 hypothetical protein [Deltaproteobacteria bacterium]